MEYNHTGHHPSIGQLEDKTAIRLQFLLKYQLISFELADWLLKVYQTVFDSGHNPVQYESRILHCLGHPMQFHIARLLGMRMVPINCG